MTTQSANNNEPLYDNNIDWRHIVIYLIISSIVVFIANSYDGMALISMLLFLTVGIYLSTIRTNNLGVLSWQTGIPIYYTVMFLLLPLFNRYVNDTRLTSDQDIADSLLVASAGLVAFGIGSTIMRHIHYDLKDNNILNNTKFALATNPKVLVCLCIIGALSAIWSYFEGYYGLIASTENTSKAAGAVSGLSLLIIISHLASWNSYFKFKQRKYLLFGIITTTTLLLSGIISNSKTAFILPFLFIGISLWGVSARFPFRLFSLILLIFTFIALPFVTVSRYLSVISGNEYSKLEVARSTFEFFISFDWIDQVKLYGEQSTTVSLGRGLSDYFSIIVHETGNSVEYLHGKTFSHAVETFIPRFLYPEKPSLNIGNWTAQHYGALASGDTVTSLSPSLMGEFYMNFGLLGVVSGMALLGFLAVIVDKHLIVSRDNWVMPYAIFCIGWQESVIGHSFLPFIKNIVFLWFVLFLLSLLLKVKYAQYS